MVELIENEIMDNGAPVSWDDIAGLVIHLLSNASKTFTTNKLNGQNKIGICEKDYSRNRGLAHVTA